MNKFTVQYTDGTEFSGNPFESEWKQIDDTKQIACLVYVVGNTCIIMEGYAEYNHTLECTALGQKGISRILLMGRKEEETDLIIFDLKENRLYKETKPKYQEYGKQILDGWQLGELKEPKSYLKKLQNKTS